ncbi:MAG: GDP-mannose 4,6-dehydratase [Hyphomicrobiaceae bacterium]
MRIVVTGGAGFAGSATCRYLVGEQGHTVLNLDSAAGAPARSALFPVAASPRYGVRRADICDRRRVRALLEAFSPDAVVHMARDDGAGEGGNGRYIRNNVVGTFALLEAVRDYWTAAPESKRRRFRYLQVSSADAFRGMAETSGATSRASAHADTPLTASLAAADHLAMAWHRTYGLPALIAAPSSVYGPYQGIACPIPRAIIAAIEDRDASVPADDPAADAAHDWLHIDDLVRALDAMLHRGTPGAGYLVGSGTSSSLSTLTARIVELVARHGARDEGRASHKVASCNDAAEAASPLSAVDTGPLQRDTGWRAQQTVESGVSQTVRWFLSNESWWRTVIDAQAEQQRVSRRLSA